MAGVLDHVDSRTQLVGRNRFELLLFRVAGAQRFGINVFKVREVIECPPLRRVPHSSPSVRGMAHVRGHTFPVIDLAQALRQPVSEDLTGHFVIITEFNRNVQGFLVRSVDRILNMNWDAILPPPTGVNLGTYLTAVTRYEDNELIGILDVEKILSEVLPEMADKQPVLEALPPPAADAKRHVLVVDDSSVARNQIARALDKAGLTCHLLQNGREALTWLQRWSRGEIKEVPDLALVISDIEMPEMDGYTLTAELKRDPALQSLYVLLHSSLSGVFNDAMVKKVGANAFLAKFSSEELCQRVLDVVARGAPAASQH